MLRLVFLAALLVTHAASAQPAAPCYTGYGYHPDNRTLIFTVRYTAVGQQPNKQQKWRAIFRDPNNAVIATKSMDFSYNKFLPVYTEHFKATGNTVGIERDTDGRWHMLKRDGAQGELHTKNFDAAPPIAGDDGIHPFIQAHFKQLMSKHTLRFKLVLPQRQSVIKMRLKRIADTQVNGQPAVRFQAKVDSFFISLFTQKLVFTYNPVNKQLLAYRGVSSMQAKKNKPYPVYVRYFQDRPPATLPKPRLPACGKALPSINPG